MAPSYLPRIALMALAGALLAGCAGRPVHPVAQPTTVTPGHATPGTRAPAPTQGTPPAAASGTRGSSPSASATVTAPESTGVPACDDYLASYKGCHRAAGIFAPNQLEDRYQAMRTSLMRDAHDPDIRPQLAARCNSLARQLRQALHGKACEPEPANSSSSP